MNPTAIDCRMSNTTAVFTDASCSYATIPPYHPSKLYPEYPFAGSFMKQDLPEKIDGYHAVRETLNLLGYDRERFGSKEWNPLGHIIQPGYKVVIKPNFVLHLNEEGFDIYAGLTHPSIIRAIADYCLIALKGSGSLSIIENPQMDCDFNAIIELMGFDKLIAFYRDVANFELQILDTRLLKCKRDYQREFYPSDTFVRNEHADPLGYTIVDLGRESALDNLDGIENLYGSDYDRRFTVQNHHRGVHKYCIAKSILAADTVICVPKMKTHKKVGVTLNMKLLVGINGDKNYLAHFRIGSPSAKGDEFPDNDKLNVRLTRTASRLADDRLLIRRSRFFDNVYLLAKAVGKPLLTFLRRCGLLADLHEVDKIRGGNWYGNDTAWRMASDLTKIFLYADVGGSLHSSPQRNVLSIVDGIVAGEGDGPMAAIPKKVGTIVAGENILAVDTAAATLMGFDYRKIKMLKSAWESSIYPLSLIPVVDTTVVSNETDLNGKTPESCVKFAFLSHRNWRGQIELELHGKCTVLDRKE